MEIIIFDPPLKCIFWLVHFSFCFAKMNTSTVNTIWPLSDARMTYLCPLTAFLCNGICIFLYFLDNSKRFYVAAMFLFLDFSVKITLFCFNFWKISLLDICLTDSVAKIYNKINQVFYFLQLHHYWLTTGPTSVRGAKDVSATNKQMKSLKVKKKRKRRRRRRREKKEEGEEGGGGGMREKKRDKEERVGEE